MKIIIKNFQKKIPIYPTRIKRTALKTLSSEGIKKTVEITICFVGSRRIRELNRKYHKRDINTDVLAFDLSRKDKKGHLAADIVISTDEAAKNAGIFKTSTAYELNLYVIHGILHLLGYDDLSKQKLAVMRKRQESIIKKIGL